MSKRILWGIILGIVVYALIGGVTDAGRLGEHLRRFPWEVFVGALGLSLVNYAVRFAKWHYYLRYLGHEQVGWRLSLNVFVAGMVMSVTPGKVGEVLKSVLLRQAAQIPAARTAPIVIAERITDLLGLFVIASLGVASFDYGRWAFGLGLAVVFAAVGVLHQPGLVAWGLRVWSRLPLVGGLHVKLEEAYASMRRLVRLDALGVGAAMSVVSWGMEGLAFYWIIEALGGQQEGVLGAMFIFSMTTIMGALSFLPAGWG